MIRRPPRSTPLYSSAASDVYKRQVVLRARLGGQPQVERLSVALDADRELFARSEARLELHLFPRRYGLARDRRDAVPRLDPRPLGRTLVVDDLHDRGLALVLRDLDADEEGERGEEERQDEIHARPREEDEEALEARPGLRHRGLGRTRDDVAFVRPQ